MTYSLEFDQRALKEWHKLGDTIRQQFKKKLAGNPGESTHRGQPLTRAARLLQGKAAQRWLSPNLPGNKPGDCGVRGRD